jgi:hypothetical protein
VSKEALEKILKERERLKRPGPTKVGWYIAIGDEEEAKGIYPHVFNTKQEAEAHVEEAVLEFIGAQTIEEQTVH